MSKHSKQVVAVIAGLWILLGVAVVANAQPVAPMPAARPAAMAPAAMPAPRPVARRPVARPVAARPAAAPMVAVMTPAMVAPAPAAMPTAAPASMAETPMDAAMAAPAAMEAPKATMEAAPAEKKESTDKKAAFWIGIVSMILMAILGILGGFGLLKWTKNDRAQMIMKLIEKGVEAFLRYSGGTKAEWDDALAKLLNDVNDYLLKAGQSPLTAEEKKQVKDMANKQKDIAGPDKNPEEKTEEKKEDDK